MMISKKAAMELAMGLIFLLLIFAARAGELHFVEHLAGGDAFRQAIYEASNLGVVLIVGVLLLLVMMWLGGGMRKK